MSRTIACGSWPALNCSITCSIAILWPLMRVRSTGRRNLVSNFSNSKQSRNCMTSPPQTPDLLSQISHQAINPIGRHVVPVLIIHHHRRRSLASPDAFRELQSDLAVRRGAAGLDVQLFAERIEPLFAAAQGARQAAADPQPRFAERLVLLAEELVEGHRIVHFRGAEVEQ